MGSGMGMRVQAVLVVLLFLASLGALLFNTVSALELSAGRPTCGTASARPGGG